MYKIVKFVRPDIGISARAKAVLCSLVKELLSRLHEEAVQLCIHASNQKALTSREVQAAVRHIYPAALAVQALEQGIIPSPLQGFVDWYETVPHNLQPKPHLQKLARPT